MIKNIQSVFLDMLYKNTWMDEKTKKAAIDKANALSIYIGYPNELTDINTLEKYCSELEIKADNYFGNVIRLAQYKLNYAFKKLRDPVNKTSWEQRSMPAVTNAFYSPVENSIRKRERTLVYSTQHYLISSKPIYTFFQSFLLECYKASC